MKYFQDKTYEEIVPNYWSLQALSAYQFSFSSVATNSQINLLLQVLKFTTLTD